MAQIHEEEMNTRYNVKLFRLKFLPVYDYTNLWHTNAVSWPAKQLASSGKHTILGSFVIKYWGIPNERLQFTGK